MTGSGAAARSIDEVAVATVQRRLARSAAPPWLHAEIAGRMAERLELFKIAPRGVVDWSSFLGAGAQHLTAAFPDAALMAVEPHALLLERSRQALHTPWWHARRWRVPATAVVLATEDAPFETQLVWSNMALHGEADPLAVMQRWQRMVSPGGLVMFSCLGPDSLRELTSLYAQLQWPAPTLPFVDMHDLGDMLVHAGLSDPVMDQEHLTVHWDSASALCSDLRQLGGNVSPDRYTGLRTPRWREALHQALETLRDRSGRLALTFEVVYGHAFKAETVVAVPADTRVPLEEMRRLVRASRKGRV